jgi:hypothetical protein
MRHSECASSRFGGKVPVATRPVVLRARRHRAVSRRRSRGCLAPVAKSAIKKGLQITFHCFHTRARPQGPGTQFAGAHYALGSMAAEIAIGQSMATAVGYWLRRG